MRKLAWSLYFVVLFSVSTARAEFAESYPGVSPPVGPAANPELVHGEQFTNFAAVYVAQWAFYLVQQNKTIVNEGSWNNYLTYWHQPHFDKDSFEYNIIKHTLTGQSYFQFYRSRGYALERAFLWTFASSLAFEFTIETLTERPSLQDIYQTPVYGVIVGYSLEKLSQACHSTQTWWGHACGYLFDPFTLIPATPKFALYPEISRDRYVANLKWEF